MFPERETSTGGAVPRVSTSQREVLEHFLRPFVRAIRGILRLQCKFSFWGRGIMAVGRLHRFGCVVHILVSPGKLLR